MNQADKGKARGWPLREFFGRCYQPNFLIEAQKGTLDAYRETFNHWERITSNPPLMAIDSETLAGFKARLRRGEGRGAKGEGRGARGERRRVGRHGPQLTLFDLQPEAVRRTRPVVPLAVATVNKHLRQVHAVLGKAGPAGPRNRDALGVLEVMPWTRPLRQRRRLPRDVRDDVIGRIYLATTAATYPKLPGVTPEHWWKALIAAALALGFRRGGLLALRWEDVDWERAEISLTAEGDKCGVERLKPLHPIVLKHLLRIRGAHELVFPWQRSMKTFYRQWHRIQEAAGLKPGQHIKLHNLKGASGTRMGRIASAWVVQQHMDHATLSTSQHYINATAEHREAIQKLPLPPEFFAEFGQAAG